MNMFLRTIWANFSKKAFKNLNKEGDATSLAIIAIKKKNIDGFKNVIANCTIDRLHLVKEYLNDNFIPECAGAFFNKYQIQAVQCEWFKDKDFGQFIDWRELSMFDLPNAAWRSGAIHGRSCEMDGYPGRRCLIKHLEHNNCEVDDELYSKIYGDDLFEMPEHFVKYNASSEVWAKWLENAKTRGSEKDIRKKLKKYLCFQNVNLNFGDDRGFCFSAKDRRNVALLANGIDDAKKFADPFHQISGLEEIVDNRNVAESIFEKMQVDFLDAYNYETMFRIRQYVKWEESVSQVQKMFGENTETLYKKTLEHGDIETFDPNNNWQQECLHGLIKLKGDINLDWFKFVTKLETTLKQLKDTDFSDWQGLVDNVRSPDIQYDMYSFARHSNDVNLLNLSNNGEPLFDEGQRLELENHFISEGLLKPDVIHCETTHISDFTL